MPTGFSPEAPDRSRRPRRRHLSDRSASTIAARSSSSLSPCGPSGQTYGFADALNLHIKRHGDSVRHLFYAVAKEDKATNHRTLMKWATGELAPRSIQSLEVLARIERRYRLPAGYFMGSCRTSVGPELARPRGLHAGRTAEAGMAPRRLQFPFRGRSGRDLDWVQRVIISGSTDYRPSKRRRSRTATPSASAPSRARASRRSNHLLMSIRRPCRRWWTRRPSSSGRWRGCSVQDLDPTAFGFQRAGVWGEETASQKVEHLGLMFGALTSPAEGPVRGFGAPRSLCFAMLVFPPVWDWYLQWREQRRGFFTKWEVGMLALLTSVVKADTGWIRQTPALADRLRPIDGLITEADIEARARRLERRLR